MFGGESRIRTYEDVRQQTTLEYKGQWREGKVFDADGLKNDLRKMGVIPSHV